MSEHAERSGQRAARPSQAASGELTYIHTHLATKLNASHIWTFFSLFPFQSEVNNTAMFGKLMSIASKKLCKFVLVFFIPHILSFL